MRTTKKNTEQFQSQSSISFQSIAETDFCDCTGTETVLKLQPKLKLT